jgi:uncharacterized protein YndB with AHSA1/START domain
VIEVDPPRRLVVSWYFPENEGDPAKTSHVAYEVTAIGAESRLVVTHSDLVDQMMLTGVSEGWPLVLSSLKTFLESGRGLAALDRRIQEMA